MRKKLNVADSLDLSESTVDTEKGVIRNVKLIGARSLNRDFSKPRRYTPEALQKATALYEGVPVHADHPRDASGRFEPGKMRTPDERVGIVENVRHVAGDAPHNRGDIRVLRSHPAGERLLEAAADPKLSKLFALSHNAIGVGEVKGEEFVIDTIELVRSVDIVSQGGTTTGLFEGQEIPDKEPDPATGKKGAGSIDADEGKDKPKETSMEWTAITLDDLRAHRPDILEAHKDEVAPKHDELKRKLTAVEAELDTHKAVSKASEKRLRMLKLCKAARLPEDAVTDTFIETLMNQGDEKDALRLIEDRRRIVRAGAPRSTAQDYTEGETGRSFKQTVDMEAATKAVAECFQN